MKHLSHDVFFESPVQEIDHGLNDMLTTFRSFAPTHKDNPVVVLLLPG